MSRRRSLSILSRSRLARNKSNNFTCGQLNSRNKGLATLTLKCQSLRNLGATQPWLRLLYSSDQAYGCVETMEHTTFCEHYRVCEDEAAHEVSRTGAAINYEAVDTRSHERVQLQLIPLATIDPEKRAQLKERAETAEKL